MANHTLFELLDNKWLRSDRPGDLMVSLMVGQLDSGSEAWDPDLASVLGQNTILTVLLSPLRSRKWVPENCQGSLLSNDWGVALR